MKSRVTTSSAASRERLAKISHHFLTAARPQSRQEVDQPMVIPVISAISEAQFPHDHLALALAARGRSARVLEISRGLRNTAKPTPTPDTARQTGAALSPQGEGAPAPVSPLEVREQIDALDPVPDFCLVPLRPDEVPVAVDLGCLLVAATPNKEGLLAAYRIAKEAWAQRPGASVGVTVMHARDRPSAALHFQKLAEGASRFLGQEILSFGYIPPPPDPYAPIDLLAGDSPDAAVQRAVEGIANLILADLEALEAEADEAQAEAEAPLRALRAAGSA